MLEADEVKAEVEETLRQKHTRKLNAETLRLKRDKKAPIRVEYELVHDSRGQKKYRKVSYMKSGIKHREPSSEAEYRKFTSHNQK